MINLTIFYLIRHAEPNWAIKDERNLQGALRDYVPLTDTGEHQAEQVIYNHEYLSNCDLILSSPYTRSLQTAAIINRKIGLPIKVEFDLHEWTPDNWKASGIDEIKQLMNDYRKHNGIYPSGESKEWESKESVLKRVKNVLYGYLDKSKVMVVCHGMVIATLFEINSDEVEFCGIYEYEITWKKHTQ